MSAVGLRFPFLKRRAQPVRGMQWLPTVLVLVVVLLAGGRLISLSVQQRAEQKRVVAEQLVTRYARTVETQLAKLADRARRSGTQTEIDQLLASVPLSGVIDPEYDFELSKVDVAGGRPRVFVSSQLEAFDDGVTARIRAPEGFSQELQRGYLQLSLRPKTGWYPARELATAIALLALVAWLLAFTAHDLVHHLHRAREALSLARRQTQMVNRKLVAEIEQRETLQQSFDHARFHDAFTGLPNRRYFMEQLDRALRDLRARRRRRLAVILIDIDRFRLINDTLGHTAGDELVVQTARRFEKAAVAQSVLARWSSDQFALLLLDVEAMDTVFEVSASLQQSLQAPFELRKHRLNVSVRLGVTCIESGLRRAEEVVREADVALSVAKQSQATQVVPYEPTMGGSAASLVSLEADLHLALARRELQLVFQPIVDLHDQRTVGVEALLRWQHPVEGLLTPDKFLSVADEAGLTIPISRWTIARACKLASEWRRRLPQDRDFYLSINLSAASLRDPELCDYVAEVLENTGVPPRMLKLELTESGLISNPGAMREVLDGLHNLGIEMMLDDFGTGYSSLSYLQLFPFDYVKIDRPLVNRAGSERANSAIAAAIIQMTNSLGLKSVAEIVETETAARDLQKMGCDYAQGNFYCEPVGAEEALQLLRIPTASGSLPESRAGRAPTTDASEDDSPTLMFPEESLAALAEQTLTMSADEIKAEFEKRKARDGSSPR
jgi:diguanylate cyclase (GGDEF)-like protein